MIDSIFNFSSVLTQTPSAPYAKTISDSERLEKLSLHLGADDYFRSLSTLLGFAEEALITGDEHLSPILIKAVEAARKDLAHLHDHYRIAPRS